MAINIQIKDQTTNNSRLVTVNFVSDILVGNTGTDPNKVQHFFVFSTTAKDTGNIAYSNKYILSLDNLVLNGTKRRISDSSAPYATIKEMIVDYAYDYINGHTADLYSSGVAAKLPMKFS